MAMKTLDSLFGTPAAADSGKRFEFGAYWFKFKMVEPHSVAFAKTRNAVFKPVMKAHSVGMLTDEKDRELTIRTYIRQGFIAWGCDDADSEQLPEPTEDNVVAFFVKYPRLWVSLAMDIQDRANFEEIEDASKN